MENFETESGLAFAMAGDHRVHATTRKIARVPLSDYVVDATAHLSLTFPWSSDAQLSGSGSEVDKHTVQLRELCAMLLGWQELQTVMLHIDDRFRFRCILSWLSASTSQRPNRINPAAAAFLQQHVNDQYEFLLIEDQNIQDIMQVRQEDGLPLTSDQEGRAVDIDEDLQQAAEAINKVRELVDLVVAAGLVDNRLQDEKRDGEEGEEQKGEAEPADVDSGWRIDSSFDGF